jgi:tetratricopeptide (TPR) repeat protein
MTDQPQRHAVLEKLPRISQKLKLTCTQCGEKASYDVGRAFYDQEGEGESAKRLYAFSNYFRCRQCGSAGPWEIADFMKLTGLTLRSVVDHGFDGVARGRTALFDGTFIQSPAMGEEYLLSLIRKDPSNAFLCSRLGNLLRNCGQTSQADHWHAKALGLDPDDIESRNHLFAAALQAGDVRSALPHALRLARSLLEGQKTDNDRLNEDIALSLAQDLRRSAEQFQACLPAGPQPTSSAKEDVFIRSLLAQKGDEQEIIEDAGERLLSGKPAPEPLTDSDLAMDTEPVADAPLLPNTDLFPTLRTLIESQGMNPGRLIVALDADDRGHIRVQDMHSLPVHDGEKMARWQVPTLQELFRGNRTPPPDMDHYPDAYAPHFFFIENHVLTLCDAMGDRTDQEMEEIYSMLRRRPDGRSLGATHDFLWQVAALLLGTQVLSGAEFEALVGALERSTRKWALRPVSRFYVDYLRKTFDEVSE